MKYIRSIFENTENEYMSDYGLVPEDIKDMFVDLEDEGYRVFVNFTKRLVQFSDTEQLEDDNLRLGLQPLITVRIKKFQPGNRENLLLTLSKLMKSDIFQDTVSVTKDRLRSMNWTIKDVKIENDYIIISIYKINI